MSITPAKLDRRATTINREAERIINAACAAHLQAARRNRDGRYIGIDTLVKHAREVATNAYDAARKRELEEAVAKRVREAAE